MRVLITGAGGQVGHELVRAFAGHDVVAATRAELDVTDRATVLAAVTTLHPDTIVHAAAFTAVDACESETDRAYLVNAAACTIVSGWNVVTAPRTVARSVTSSSARVAATVSWPAKARTSS